MIIVVIWKDTKTFKINIDPKKKVIELKEEIARHFGAKPNDFNILNGTEIIDNSRNFETIESCNIKRIIRLPPNYNPGYLYYYLFNI